jgi:predicted RNA binding protein YcfA (HicA-like mRNA interferase family)
MSKRERKIARGAKGIVKTIVRTAAGDGWSVSMSGGNHIRFDHPQAARPVYTALTPQGQFAHKRLLGDMKRALRQEEQTWTPT